MSGYWHLYLRNLRRYRLAIDTDQVDEDVLSFASRYGLTGYDAEYLETAIRRNARLATFDKKLLSAAKRVGVEFDMHEASTAD